jgi:hypothetical protein
VTYGEATTPSLYYGPEGRGAACTSANEIGRLLCPPIGDGGLKTEDARMAVELVTEGTIGDATPTLVIGPLDSATPEAADALLKTLEDLSGYVSLCLWAECLEGVIPTIRSRTRAIWCPATATTIDPVDSFATQGAEVVAAVLKGDVGTAIRIMGEHGKAGKLPSRESLLLRAMSRALVSEVSEGSDAKQVQKAITLWRSIRRVMEHPTPLACSAALLGGETP